MTSHLQDFLLSAPYNRELSLTLKSAGGHACVIEAPYRSRLIGNPETGVLHGGVVTALLDVAFGAAIYLQLRRPRPIATLDLRIDYLKPGTPGRSLLCSASCYKVTTELAFVRGTVYNDNPDDLIASGVGIFMFTKGPRAHLGGGLKQ